MYLCPLPPGRLDSFDLVEALAAVEIDLYQPGRRTNIPLLPLFCCFNSLALHHHACYNAHVVISPLDAINWFLFYGRP